MGAGSNPDPSPTGNATAHRHQVFSGQVFEPETAAGFIRIRYRNRAKLAKRNCFNNTPLEFQLINTSEKTIGYNTPFAGAHEAHSLVYKQSSSGSNSFLALKR